MLKTIYAKKINGVNCVIELLDVEKDANMDTVIIGYTIGDLGGLQHGNDLLKYICALETECFEILKECSQNAICFVNDLARNGLIDKKTYCKICNGEEKTFDLITS